MLSREVWANLSILITIVLLTTIEKRKKVRLSPDSRSTDLMMVPHDPRGVRLVNDSIPSASAGQAFMPGETAMPHAYEAGVSVLYDHNVRGQRRQRGVPLRKAGTRALYAFMVAVDKGIPETSALECAVLAWRRCRPADGESEIRHYIEYMKTAMLVRRPDGRYDWRCSAHGLCSG
jgi:hypothetical protein